MTQFSWWFICYMYQVPENTVTLHYKRQWFFIEIATWNITLYQTPTIYVDKSIDGVSLYIYLTPTIYVDKSIYGVSLDIYLTPSVQLEGNSGRNLIGIAIIWSEPDGHLQSCSDLAIFLTGFDIISLVFLSNTIICNFYSTILWWTFL